MFTQNCFIRENTPELRNKLREITGTKRWLFSLRNGYGENIVHIQVIDSAVDDDEINRMVDNPSFVDCGKNEELFLAIAALNDKNDYMQWFVTEADQSWVNQGVYCPRGSFTLCTIEHRYPEEWRGNEEFYSSVIPAHKASVEELIEHFK